MTTKEITIADIGPIRNLRIPLKESGGVIVLRGRNGLGKTTALEAVDAAVKGDGGLSVRRGAAKGAVDACGVALRVTRSTRRSGELEVDALEGKLSVAELVDPGLKDEAAADRVRIRALLHVVQFDGSTAAPRFRALLPSEFDKIVQPDALATSDPVEMASKIKRDIEREALRLERESESLSGRAKGLDDSVHGIAEPAGTEVELAKAASDASLQLDKAVRHNQEVTRLLAERRRASESIERSRASYTGGTIADAKARNDKATANHKRAADDVRDLERRLAEARSVLALAAAESSASEAALSAALSFESTIAELQSQVDKAIPEPLSEDALEAFAATKREAEELVATAAVARKAAADRAVVAQMRRESKEMHNRAAKLREAAKATDGVLTDLVSTTCVALAVNQGRLVYRDGSGERLYHELSMGERWRVGLDIALNAAAKLADSRGVLLTIPQESWESLDPQNRASIAAQARGADTWILTAEATGDESLVVDVFE